VVTDFNAFVYFICAVNVNCDMDEPVAVIPKVENIFVHTGNIVNWSRLKETVSKSATNEVI